MLAQVENKMGFVLALSAMVITLLLGMLWWSYTIDDSFINYRYAENMAMGNGLVFNVGERIEGYSSPFWVLFLALIAFIGLCPILISKIVGLVCAVGIVYLLYWSLRHCSCNPLIAGIACLWFAAVSYLHIYSCSGMETIPYTFIVSCAAFLLVVSRSSLSNLLLLPAIIIGVATLRPEGILIALAVTLWWFGWRRQRTVLLGLLLAWAVIAALLVWRFSYYGSFLPNTFIAKLSPITAALDQGIISVVLRVGAQITAELDPFISSLGGFILLALAILSIVDKRRGFEAGGALLIFFAGALFVVYAPNDWMPGHRLGLPYAAPLIFAGALGLDFLYTKLTAHAWRLLRVACIVCAAGWLILGGMKITKLWMLYDRGHINTGLNGELYSDIGRWLRDNGSPSDRVLTYEIGGVGYYSSLYIIDHEGLVNREMAEIIHSAGGYGKIRYGADPKSMEALADLCVAQKPDWFMVRSTTSTRVEIGRSINPAIAQETIQQAVLEKQGDSMILETVFPLRPSDPSSQDCYLLLRCRTVSESTP